MIPSPISIRQFARGNGHGSREDAKTRRNQFWAGDDRAEDRAVPLIEADASRIDFSIPDPHRCRRLEETSNEFDRKKQSITSAETCKTTSFVPSRLCTSLAATTESLSRCNRSPQESIPRMSKVKAESNFRMHGAMHFPMHSYCQLHGVD